MTLSIPRGPMVSDMFAKQSEALFIFVARITVEAKELPDIVDELIKAIRWTDQGSAN